MKSHFNAVFYMSAVFLIVWAPEGFSLQCHTCFSALSWDDCLKNSKVWNCTASFKTETVCLKVIRSKLLKSNQQVVEFGKSCYPKAMCNTASCEEELMREDFSTAKAVRCYVECCSGDRCNSGKLSTTPEVSELVSKAVIPFISCLCVMTLVVVSFILVND